MTVYGLRRSVQTAIIGTRIRDRGRRGLTLAMREVWRDTNPRKGSDVGWRDYA